MRAARTALGIPMSNEEGEEAEAAKVAAAAPAGPAEAGGERTGASRVPPPAESGGEWIIAWRCEACGVCVLAWPSRAEVPAKPHAGPRVKEVEGTGDEAFAEGHDYTVTDDGRVLDVTGQVRLLLAVGSSLVVALARPTATRP